MQMLSFEFLFGISLVTLILSHIDIFSKTLQYLLKIQLPLYHTVVTERDHCKDSAFCSSDQSLLFFKFNFLNTSKQ